MTFAAWLDTFISEKRIDLNRLITMTGPDNQVNHIPVGCIVDAIKETSACEQDQIKNMLVKLDFKGIDTTDYLRHLAQAMMV